MNRRRLLSLASVAPLAPVMAMMPAGAAPVAALSPKKFGYVHHSHNIAPYIEVYLDGVMQHNCTEVDDVKGFVVRYVPRRAPETETLYGNVEIRLEPLDGPPMRLDLE